MRRVLVGLTGEAIAFAIDNVRGGLVLAGAGLVYIGVASWSRPGANVFAGVLLMLVGAAPYLRRRKG